MFNILHDFLEGSDLLLGECAVFQIVQLNVDQKTVLLVIVFRYCEEFFHRRIVDRLAELFLTAVITNGKRIPIGGDDIILLASVTFLFIASDHGILNEVDYSFIKTVTIAAYADRVRKTPNVTPAMVVMANILSKPAPANNNGTIATTVQK